MNEEYIKLIQSTHPLYLHWNNLRSKRKYGPSMCASWAHDRLKFFRWCYSHGWQEGARFVKRDKELPHSPENTFLLPALKDIFGENYHAPMAALSRDEIFEIRKLLHEEVPQVMIARKYKVSVGAISAIKLRRTWAHLL